MGTIWVLKKAVGLSSSFNLLLFISADGMTEGGKDVEKDQERKREIKS